MRLLLIPVIGLLLITQPLVAQYYQYDLLHYDHDLIVEAGMNVGLMNALTDLGGKNARGSNGWKDINGTEWHATYGIFVQTTWRNKIAVVMEFNRGKVSAADSLIGENNALARGRYLRNLHFQSTIFEAAVSIICYPLSFLSGGGFRCSPYLGGGIGLFHFNPKAKYEGSWVELAPLHTEGQGFAAYPTRRPYNRWQTCLPLALGVKYECNARLAVYLDLRYRLLHTDYLDDVSTEYIDPPAWQQYFTVVKAAMAASLANRQRLTDNVTFYDKQRGNPSNNDSYFGGSIKIAFVLNRQRIH